MASFDRFDALDLRDMLSDISFDAHLEGHLRRRTPYAGTEEADLDNSCFGDADELEVAAVGLNGGADQLDHSGDACFEFAHVRAGQLLISHVLK